MHLRYQIVLPDKTIRYETDSLSDAKRAWRFSVGAGAVVRDVLHEAGLVDKAGDNTPFNAITAHMIDHLAGEAETALQRPLKLKSEVRAALWEQMYELVERTLVGAVTSVHPDLDVEVKT